jgi:hypothetical protein
LPFKAEIYAKDIVYNIAHEVPSVKSEVLYVDKKITIRLSLSASNARKKSFGQCCCEINRCRRGFLHNGMQHPKTATILTTLQ